MDEDVWFTCGLQELAAKQSDQAWACWRRSIELSDRHLQDILTKSAALLSPEQIMDNILPPRPENLLAAATHLGPKATLQQQRAYLQRALAQLTSGPDASTLEGLHTKALICKALGRKDEALAAFRELVAADPDQVDYQCEFARYLYDLGQLEEARITLVRAVARHPNHNPARELLQIVTKDMLRGVQR